MGRKKTTLNLTPELPEVRSTDFNLFYRPEQAPRDTSIDIFTKSLDRFVNQAGTAMVLQAEVKEEEKFRVVEDFVNKAKFEGGSKITIDGLRVDFEDGWGLIRASNTTPKLVLRFEAKTPSRLKEIKNMFLNQLKLIDETIHIDIS